MMTEQTQTARFKIGEHVHILDSVDDTLAVCVETPGTVIAIDDTSDPTQRVYVVRCCDAVKTTRTVGDVQLSSECDLIEQLRRERQLISERTLDDDDHGPGCDGPLNCTCSVPCDRCSTPIPESSNARSPQYCDSCAAIVSANGGEELPEASIVDADELFSAAACDRKIAEFDAVRSTLDNVIAALVNARDELHSWEIDDYADSEALSCSEAYELIHASAAALLAMTSVADDAAIADVADAALSTAKNDAASLRSGTIVVPGFGFSHESVS